MTDKLDWNIPFAGTAGMEMHRPGGVRDAIRAARLYEQLGYVATGYSDQMQSWIFRSIWSPELIPTAAQVPDYEACYNTIPLLAAVASHTEKILLSTIVDCYRRSPSILAQELLTLDHISHGRVMIAIGTGENKQFLPYGLERTEPRNAHLEEAIRIIKTLMRTTQPVTEPDNRFWKLDEALVALPPYNPEHPPLVLLAGGGPRPMRIAGRVADGLLTYLPGGYADQVTSWEADLAEMWSEAERRDRDPKSLVIAPGVTMILCENDRQISASPGKSVRPEFCAQSDPRRSPLVQMGRQTPTGRRLGAQPHPPFDQVFPRRAAQCLRHDERRGRSAPDVCGDARGGRVSGGALVSQCRLLGRAADPGELRHRALPGTARAR